MSVAEVDTLPVIETPIEAEAEFPAVANIQPAGREFPDDAWLNLPNVPVFAEHSTTTKSGRQLTFGRHELAILAANCNRRIRDTGDYAGIIVGHTPDPETGPSAFGFGFGESPLPLAGLAGPFRLGLIRQPGGEAKWAILADFHVRREQANVIRDYPRRSAELWLADEIEDMYLDPIALLGGETPRLDMGLLYSAERRSDGRRVEKYSASAPSATSVFVPGHEPRKDYAAESGADSAPSNPNDSTPDHERTAMPLTPEDLKQIVDALEEQQWVQWVKAQMEADQTPPPSPAPTDTPPPAEPAATPTPSDSPPTDETLPVKYSRLSAQVGTLNQTVDTLRTQLEEERARRVNTERYAALADCRRTRLFDLEAEFELVKYGKVSDEQFTAHVERIAANYREIPLDTSLPTFDLPAATLSNRPGGQATKERYGKEVSDKALAIAKRKAMNGEPVSYEEVLEQVAKGES